MCTFLSIHQSSNGFLKLKTKNSWNWLMFCVLRTSLQNLFNFRFEFIQIRSIQFVNHFWFDKLMKSATFRKRITNSNSTNPQAKSQLTKMLFKFKVTKMVYSFLGLQYYCLLSDVYEKIRCCLQQWAVSTVRYFIKFAILANIFE